MKVKFSGEIVDDKLKIISRNSWIILDDSVKFPVEEEQFLMMIQLLRFGVLDQIMTKKMVLYSKNLW